MYREQSGPCRPRQLRGLRPDQGEWGSESSRSRSQHWDNLSSRSTSGSPDSSQPTQVAPVTVQRPDARERVQESERTSEAGTPEEEVVWQPARVPCGGPREQKKGAREKGPKIPTQRPRERGGWGASGGRARSGVLVELSLRAGAFEIARSRPHAR